jgi:uncharacterized protein (TIRG00374 family)
MPQKISKIIQGVLKVIFAAAIIVWLVGSGKINLKAVADIFLSWYVVPIMGLSLLALFLCSERWRVFLQHQGLQSSRLEVLKLSLIGAFFNFAIPGGVGGDVVKSYYLVKEHPHKKMAGVMSVLMDRVLGLYAMILMAFIAMLIDRHQILSVQELKMIFILVCCLAFGLTIGLAAALSKTIHQKKWIHAVTQRIPMGHRFYQIYEIIYSYHDDKSRLVKATLLSAVAQFSSICILILVGIALHIEHIPWVTYFVAAPIGFIVTALPIAPAGVGVGQAAFDYLFNIFSGQVTQFGATSITIFQVGQFVLGLAGAVIYIMRRPQGGIPLSTNPETTSVVQVF